MPEADGRADRLGIARLRQEVEDQPVEKAGPLEEDSARGARDHRQLAVGRRLVEGDRELPLTILTATAASYTPGMKTAVSVPDDLFAQVDRLAMRSHRSRSAVYSAALREYVARHAPDEVTAGLDQVVSEIGDTGDDRFASAAARRTLGATEW